MPTASDSSSETNNARLQVAPQPAREAPRRSKAPVIGFILIAAVLVGWAAYMLANRPAENSAASAQVYVPTAVVQAGTLDRTLRVAGQTSARNFGKIVVPILRGQQGGRGSLTLTKLIPGGTKVKTGDEVAALDTENIATQIDDLKANIEQAELDLGKLKAQQALDWLTLEQTVRSRQARFDQATLDYKAADVKTPIEQELLKLQVDETSALYKQQQVALPFRKTSQQAALRMSEIGLKQRTLRYEKFQNDIKTFTFRAPIDGLVVLQSFERSGGNMAQYQVGDSVGAGQTFMKIVDTSSMQLEARASQAETSEIRVGQPAVVTLDAFPGLEFQGRVYSLGAMATQGQRENYFVRTVTVIVRIQGNDSRLIPDLSGAAQVLLARKENTILVPLESLFPEGDKNFVYLKTAKGFVKRSVELGLRSTTHGEILSGLRAGDEIALSKPPTKS